MKISTWNINSIKIRLSPLIEILKGNNIDYICLQETKVKDENFPSDELKEYGYYSYYSGEGGKNGVAIISKKIGGYEKLGFLMEKQTLRED